MKTLILEGTCTALSSISHNGGEKNGTIVQLRREKFVQPKGKIVEIPVISGNSIRGKLRDLAAIEILTKKDGVKVQVDADSFNLLFSGGSLENVGEKNLNIEKVRKMRQDIPMISVLGCSIGNIILPGKVDIGKMIPICKETLHLIPEKFHYSCIPIIEYFGETDFTSSELFEFFNLNDEVTDFKYEIKDNLIYFTAKRNSTNIQGYKDITTIGSKLRPQFSRTKYIKQEIKTIWEYCQVEMNTRKDDTKDEAKREFIKKEDLTEDLRGGQMMYYIETLVTGTRFYWKVCLRDPTDIETGAFLLTLQSWANQSSQVGGNGRVGHGHLKVDLTETSVIDSDVKFENSDFVTYIDKANEAKKDVTNYFEKGMQKNLFE